MGSATEGYHSEGFEKVPWLFRVFNRNLTVDIVLSIETMRYIRLDRYRLCDNMRSKTDRAVRRSISKTNATVCRQQYFQIFIKNNKTHCTFCIITDRSKHCSNSAYYCHKKPNDFIQLLFGKLTSKTYCKLTLSAVIVKISVPSRPFDKCDKSIVSIQSGWQP